MEIFFDNNNLKIKLGVTSTGHQQLKINGPLGSSGILFKNLINIKYYQHTCGSHYFIIKPNLNSQTLINVAFLKNYFHTIYRLINDIHYKSFIGNSISMKLSGMGYKGYVENNSLILNIGNSHFHTIKIPFGMSYTQISNKYFIFKHLDSKILGKFRNSISKLKSPDYYKQTGVLWEGDLITLSYKLKNAKTK